MVPIDVAIRNAPFHGILRLHRHQISQNLGRRRGGKAPQTITKPLSQRSNTSPHLWWGSPRPNTCELSPLYSIRNRARTRNRARKILHRLIGSITSTSTSTSTKTRSLSHRYCPRPMPSADVLSDFNPALPCFVRNSAGDKKAVQRHLRVVEELGPALCPAKAPCLR